MATAHPGLKHGPQPIQYRADRAFGCAREVNIFRVAVRLREVQLVEGRPAAKAQFLAQEIVVEDFDEGAAYDEILLDLPIFRPRSIAAPGDNVHGGDHWSSSGRRRTRTFQRALRSAGLLDLAAHLAGSSSTQGRAFSFCRNVCSPSAASLCLT